MSRATWVVGQLVGTPHYMSPEAVGGAQNVGPPSDVYAVGAVASALVSGHQVFGGSSIDEVIGRHIHTKPVPPKRSVPEGRA